MSPRNGWMRPDVIARRQNVGRPSIAGGLGPGLLAESGDDSGPVTLTRRASKSI